MLELTREELGFLRQLEQGERTISGNKDRRGLGRLIEAEYVKERALNISDTIYTITPLGRAVAQGVSR
jgi:hypothetical protein